MKKNYIFTLLLTFCICSITIGQETLLNGGFENWDDDNSPTDWTKVENITKESTEFHGGTFSAKHLGGTKDLGQTITGIVAGNSYTITIWYKVIENDGTDARIWSYWKDSSNANVTDAATDAALRGPDNNYLDNNGGVWTKYEVSVTAPAEATGLYFELRTYSGATVYWDDLSFTKNATASIKENTIEGFSTYPNPINSGEFTVSSASSIEKTVKIYSVIGKDVFTEKFTGHSKKLEVSFLNKGIYILKVTEGDKIATQKLVIK
jgi:hypothetical protein